MGHTTHSHLRYSVRRMISTVRPGDQFIKTRTKIALITVIFDVQTMIQTLKDLA